jgi:hypothetical protein
MEHLDRNLHAKLQGMCDCYMDTDYLPELGKAVNSKGNDLEENSTKYLALAILEALTQKAKKLTIKRKENISVKVTSFDETTSLPAPTDEMATKIFEIVRSIVHLDGDSGESALAFGLRNGQLDLNVKLKKKEGKESLKIIFPELEPQ